MPDKNTKQRLAVIKLGSTFNGLKAEKGDFDDWIVRGLKLKLDRVCIVDITANHPLPDLDRINGVVMSGAHPNLTDNPPRAEDVATWLPPLVQRNIPILGICFGHQLLAKALGGKVGNNPAGREFGTVDIRLNDFGRRDPLLGAMPNPFKAHVCHQQTVLELPASAKRLAFSGMDPNQAFVVGASAWGLQFHPEFDQDTTETYIRECHDQLAAEGQSPDDLLNTCCQTPYASSLLQRFAWICSQ